MEIARLKAELAKTRMERLCRATSKSLAHSDALSGAERQRQRLSSISRASERNTASAQPGRRLCDMALMAHINIKG